MQFKSSHFFHYRFCTNNFIQCIWFSINPPARATMYLGPTTIPLLSGPCSISLHEHSALVPATIVPSLYLQSTTSSKLTLAHAYMAPSSSLIIEATTSKPAPVHPNTGLSKSLFLPLLTSLLTSLLYHHHLQSPTILHLLLFKPDIIPVQMIKSIDCHLHPINFITLASKPTHFKEVKRSKMGTSYMHSLNMAHGPFHSLSSHNVVGCKCVFRLK